MKVKASFVTSAAAPADFPPVGAPEIAVVGRSNVGKSSLINAMLGSDLARTSRTPGRTRLLNWFEVSAKPPFQLVDLPGFGYAAVSADMRESWRPLIETYLAERTTLAGVVLLIDIRRGPEDEELDFVPWLAAREMPVLVVLTKADKLAKNKRTLEVMRARKVLDLRRDPFAVSAQTGDGIEPLWRAALSAHARSKGTPSFEPATAADLDAIDAIELHAFPVPWPRSVFAAELAREWARIDVACERDVIAFHNWWYVAGEIHELAIATHPDHRRKGIGHALLAHALDEGRALGGTAATLEVRRGNGPAITLYERLGFRTVHVRASYYTDGEDAFVMSARVSEVKADGPRAGHRRRRAAASVTDVGVVAVREEHAPPAAPTTITLAAATTYQRVYQAPLPPGFCSRTGILISPSAGRAIEVSNGKKPRFSTWMS